VARIPATSSAVQTALAEKEECGCLAVEEVDAASKQPTAKGVVILLLGLPAYLFWRKRGGVAA
jgi:hypothetical protein